MKLSSTLSLSALALVGLVRTAAADSPAVDCTTLPNPVYFPATTDIRATLTRVAPFLATSSAGANRMTILYQSLSSCIALDALLNNTDLTGTPTYWTGKINPDGKPEEKTCMLPAGIKATLAASDITVSTCRGTDLPAGFTQYPSFVQTFLFVVPRNSPQKAITATEGYFVMKFGGAAGKQVPPWTNPQFIVIRNPAASTQLVIGQAIGWSGTKWSASLTNTNSGSGDVVSKVKAENTTGNAEATLGILSSQRYDQERANLKGLAFEAFDQSCLGAVLPDSNDGATDKKNVRDGHYPIWANLELVAKTDANGPTDPLAKRFIDFMTGKTVAAGLDLNQAVSTAGGVPTCAMSVSRAFDGAPLERYTPAEPCACLFERAATGRTSCTTCGPNNACTGGAQCRSGFCEAR